MSSDIGLTPDPVAVTFRHVARLFSAEDQEILYMHHLPDGYNCHTDGMAVVVAVVSNGAR